MQCLENGAKYLGGTTPCTAGLGQGGGRRNPTDTCLLACKFKIAPLVRDVGWQIP